MLVIFRSSEACFDLFTDRFRINDMVRLEKCKLRPFGATGLL